jgi:hypothetical protein
MSRHAFELAIGLLQARPDLLLSAQTRWAGLVGTAVGCAEICVHRGARGFDTRQANRWKHRGRGQRARRARAGSAFTVHRTTAGRGDGDYDHENGEHGFDHGRFKLTLLDGQAACDAEPTLVKSRRDPDAEYRTASSRLWTRSPKALPCRRSRLGDPPRAPRQQCMRLCPVADTFTFSTQLVEQYVFGHLRQAR